MEMYQIRLVYRNAFGVKQMFTHKGYIVGHDNRTPDGYKRLIVLRSTKNFWVTKTGQKYRKFDGRAVGVGDWPVYYLDINSIVDLEKS